MALPQPTAAQPAGPDRTQAVIAAFTLAAIGLHLGLWFGLGSVPLTAGVRLEQLPLFAALLFGGVPQIVELARKLFHGEFGSDLLAGMSIVTSVFLGEFLAGAIV